MTQRRRLAVSAVMAAALIALSGYFFGARGYAGAAAVSLLVVAWRHDNDAGFCFPLAMLFLIVIAVMLMLFFMLITVRPH